MRSSVTFGCLCVKPNPPARCLTCGCCWHDLSSMCSGSIGLVLGRSLCYCGLGHWVCLQLSFFYQCQLPSQWFVFRLVGLCRLWSCSHMFRVHRAFGLALGLSHVACIRVYHLAYSSPRSHPESLPSASLLFLSFPPLFFLLFLSFPTVGSCTVQG